MVFFSSMPTRSILPKYTVPPTPPIIHRRVSLGQTPHGLVLFPHTSEPSDGPVKGVQVGWGVKGDVVAWTGQAEPCVELGGVLGIVRLWDSEWSWSGVEAKGELICRRLPPCVPRE